MASSKSTIRDDPGETELVSNTKQKHPQYMNMGKDLQKGDG